MHLCEHGGPECVCEHRGVCVSLEGCVCVCVHVCECGGVCVSMEVQVCV